MSDFDWYQKRLQKLRRMKTVYLTMEIDVAGPLKVQIETACCLQRSNQASIQE